MSSSSYQDNKFDSSSSDDEADQDDMLYIPVDSDDEIKVRTADSDSSYSSDTESSDAGSNRSQSSKETHKTEDGEFNLSELVNYWQCNRYWSCLANCLICYY